MELPLVRTSERNDFKRCPWLWYQSWVVGLTTRRNPTWAWFGTAIHAGLEARYKKGNKRGSVKKMLEAFTDTIAADGLVNVTAAYKASQPSFAVATTPGLSTASVRPARPAKKKGGGTKKRKLRMIDGELRLHKSGRAFISGVAAEEVDDNDDFDDTLGRMN